MAGAMAGSAILELRDPSPKLRLLTLTVNNTCNLSCPHCYLQYAGEDRFISDEVVAWLLNSACDRIAIVGKEPLATNESALRSWDIIKRAAAAGKRVSLITNGLGLDYLPADLDDVVDFVDVSFDGGPESYQRYRGPSFTKLVQRMARRASHGFRRFRALSVLSSATIDSLEDVLLVADLDEVEILMLSPYVPTHNDGINSVAPVPLDRILASLSDSPRFRHSDKALLLLATHELAIIGQDPDALNALVDHLGLRSKIAFIDRDPLELGVLRVTYDGYVMTPLQSLHPAEYPALTIQVMDKPIDDLYAALRANVNTARYHAN